MSARSVAGWIALVAGALFLAGVIASSLWPASFGGPYGPGMMGPGMMGPGGMGPGMMGFGVSGPAASPIPGAAEVRVTATNFAFQPSEIHLPKSTAVNLTFTNAAGTGVIHDLTVPGLGIHVVADPGQTRTVGLRDLAAGRYDAFCSVPGHADLGMRATVIVE